MVGYCGLKCVLATESIKTYSSVVMNPVSSDRNRNIMKMQQQIETAETKTGREDVSEGFKPSP